MLCKKTSNVMRLLETSKVYVSRFSGFSFWRVKGMGGKLVSRYNANSSVNSWAIGPLVHRSEYFVCLEGKELNKKLI